MPKYMFVYRGGHEDMEHSSPEQMQQVMQMWMGLDPGWRRSRLDG